MAAYIKKGGAGTLGFNDMTAVTSILETLLDKLRKQEMTLTDEMASALLEAGDVIARQSAAHREGGKVDSNAVGAMCARLEGFLAPVNPDESDNNSGSTSRGNKGDSEELPENSDYGFFGQQPQIKLGTVAEEEQDDYGFFREK